ncbi:glycosyltransferase family 39 protein [Laspinema olomoucense]|uniref:Glycosyltransferase family 39 protein n=1 Tax=Laspinema olomoucense D3b TaxID=2953688 RepID=A0ABT2N2J5_9CYAN|nr:glycosyltransferase family 39 protein [Laspinema sp. D3b]MCT7976909.1 glycosyltransferase family 39 protein [Laspinema sp. D3b]
MKTSQLYWNRLRLFVVLVLIIGTFFRFYHLDHKIYWVDEVNTSLRVAGYQKSNFYEQLPTGETLTIAQLHQFQSLSPERGWGDTIKALAENAEHGPIYYLFTRLWMQIFGSSITVTRSVAVLFGLLAFPAIYYLSLELFSAPLVAWIAMSLVAVSPLHLLYAQEARQYSLWTLITLVSSLALLRSLRLNTRGSWAIYAGTVVLGFYSHLISALVFFGHGLYVGFQEQWKWTKSFKSYLIASGLGFAALLPWIVVYFKHNSRLGGWLEKDTPLQALVQRWVVNLTSVFFDLHSIYPQRFFDVESGQDFPPLAWENFWGYAVIPMILFVGYALWVTLRKTPKSVGWFLLTSIAANGLFLMLYDVISGGQRSGIARYLFPSYLALQLAVAYLFADRLRLDRGRNLQRRFWQVAYVALLGVGIVSCAVSASAETWWNKYSCYYDVEVAQLVNQAENPLVIGSNDRLSRLMALSYKLNPEVRFLLLTDSDRLEMTEPSSSLFLFRPSLELYQNLESDPRYTLTPIHPFGHIWTVEPVRTPGDESRLNSYPIRG